MLWDCGFGLRLCFGYGRGSGLCLWCFDLLLLMVVCGVCVVLDCIWWFCLGLVVSVGFARYSFPGV